MSRAAERTCDSCGERPATGQIYLSHPLSEREQRKYNPPRTEGVRDGSYSVPHEASVRP